MVKTSTEKFDAWFNSLPQDEEGFVVLHGARLNYGMALSGWIAHAESVALEEIPEKLLVKEITEIWGTFDHTTFNQQSTAVAFGKAVLALRQVKE